MSQCKASAKFLCSQCCRYVHKGLFRNVCAEHAQGKKKLHKVTALEEIKDFCCGPSFPVSNRNLVGYLLTFHCPFVWLSSSLEFSVTEIDKLNENDYVPVLFAMYSYYCASLFKCTV